MTNMTITRNLKTHDNFANVSRLKPTQPKHLVLLCSTLFGLVSLLSGCADKPADGAAGGPPGGGRPPARVYVAQVELQQVTPQTIVVGTVVPKRTSMVASGADGKVNKLLVREGDVVEEGQELSVLNQVTTDLGIREAEQVLEIRKQEWEELKNGSRPEEISKAIADVGAAKSALDAALIRLGRQRELERNQAVNQDELDNAVERAETTRQQYEAAKAQAVLVQKGPRVEQINQAEASYRAQQQQVEYLKAEKGKRTTTAPFRGIVVAEHTQDGEWLSKGDAVVTIADLLDEVYVVANIDQLEVQNIRPDKEVAVEINSPGKREWTGVVESMIPRSRWESGSRTFPVKVTVKNEMIEIGGKPISRLSEGMYARVTFSGEEREALLVPKNSVIRSENGSRVVTVMPGEKPGAGTAKLVMIREGVPFGDFIEVLDSELEPGATVVVEGAERLTPFQSVQIAQPPGTETASEAPEDKKSAPDSEETD